MTGRHMSHAHQIAANPHTVRHTVPPWEFSGALNGSPLVRTLCGHVEAPDRLRLLTVTNTDLPECPDCAARAQRLEVVA